MLKCVWFAVIIQQDSKLLLNTVHDVVGRSFTNWQTLNVEDVELAVTLLYQLAEALPVSVFICFILTTQVLFNYIYIFFNF